ncbi:GTPase-activating protein, partial [Trachipleistophora hominis]
VMENRTVMKNKDNMIEENSVNMNNNNENSVTNTNSTNTNTNPTNTNTNPTNSTNTTANTTNYIEERIEYKIYSHISEQLDISNFVPRNYYELRNYCYYGYSNALLRPKFWKLLLGYLPKNKFKTEYHLKERRKLYHFYYEKANAVLMDNPGIDDAINKDVDRVCILPVTVGVHDGSIAQKCSFLDSCADRMHRNALKRILLTFKVTNSSVGYTQGMHMVLIPIYYVFSTSKDIDDVRYAEEDAFFCFFNLMSEIGEHFISEYDYDCTVGIRKKMDSVLELVRRYDAELYAVMERKKISETMFHLRWVSLLLCSEFEIEQVLVLWDKLFADSYRFEMVIYCCAAIIVLMKNAIVESGFDECMGVLQATKKDDVLTVFALADKMRREYNGDQ